MVAFINALVLLLIISSLKNILQKAFHPHVTWWWNFKEQSENGTIKEVEERAYGDNVNIYVYNNITRTPPWTDNAIPIHNHDGAGYSYISSPPARYGNFLSTEMLEAKTIFSLPWANSICTHTQQCLHARLHRHASLHMIVGHVQI